MIRVRPIPRTSTSQAAHEGRGSDIVARMAPAVHPATRRLRSVTPSSFLVLFALLLSFSVAIVIAHILICILTSREYTCAMSTRRIRKPQPIHLVLTMTLLCLMGFARHYYAQFTSAASTSTRRVETSLASSNPGLYSINHFIDGDTISVTINGRAESVRLIGVDTPETHKPNTPVQCYGETAAAYTKKLIGWGKVRLGADSLSSNRDRYNRLLRYVYLPDGRLLDELLIQEGYGFAYVQFPFTKSETFSNDQATARAQQKGLWGTCRPFQETSGRWQTNTAP
jgi:endonuclease YncB( thermonuclease family)